MKSSCFHGHVSALVRLSANRLTLGLLCALWLSACSHPALELARRQAAQGQQEAALGTLVQAARQSPQDRELRQALTAQRDLAVAQLVAQADAARASGRRADLDGVLQRLEQAAPSHPRVAWLRTELARSDRHARLLAQGDAAMASQAYDKAEVAYRAVLSEDPSARRAREQLGRIEEMREAQSRQQATLQLAMANRPVTLEFREASLRTVFEALARAADVNFVFDKDVRSEAKVTLFLKGTTVEEAMRVILGTQQLGHKLLNDNTVLVFPGTQQKQRDMLDTVTRTFYLTNADPKQVQTLIRTVAKSRDLYVDERLNLIVVRDTPEVIRLVERLVQSVDIADPEVMMDIEVMEVSRNELETLGIKWPTTVSYGLNDASTTITRASNLTTFTTNPLAVASLTASGANTRILANPKIRARNREKAKVVLAEKLPVFTTTSTPVTTGVSNAVSISYVDVGLKLDVEPQVQLDDDVSIKVGLEVSSITNTLSGPGGSIAYQVGTRQASTTLRLRDGETQILAGLINDSESRSSSGLPYLHSLPLLGRLFGVTTDESKKTEIVLLVTPHIVRNVVQPAVSGTGVPSGTETQPGAAPMSLRDGASTSGVGGSAGGAAGRAVPAGAQPGRPGAATGIRLLTGPEEVHAGALFAVTVRNPEVTPMNVNLDIDSAVLTFDGAQAGPSRRAVSVPPGGQLQVMMQALPTQVDADGRIELDNGLASWRVRIKAPVPADAAGPADPMPAGNDTER